MPRLITTTLALLLLSVSAYSVQTNTFIYFQKAGENDKTAALNIDVRKTQKATDTFKVFDFHFIGFDGKKPAKVEGKASAFNVDLSQIVIIQQEKLEKGLYRVTWLDNRKTATNIMAEFTNAPVITVSTNLKADFTDFQKFQNQTIKTLVENALSAKIAADRKPPYPEMIPLRFTYAEPGQENIEGEYYSVTVKLKIKPIK